MLDNPKATRVVASGTIAFHNGLKPFGEVDNGLDTSEL